MAVILRGIFGLGLAAQHDLVDELFGVASLHPREDAVEALGRSVPPLASEMSSVARNSRSAWSFSAAGSSWTR